MANDPPLIHHQDIVKRLLKPLTFWVAAFCGWWPNPGLSQESHQHAIKAVETTGRSFAFAARDLQDLSDLCWIGGDRYLAVSDKKPLLIDLSIQLEASGKITSAGVRRVDPILDARGQPAKLSDLESLCREPIDPTPDAATPALYLAEEAGRIHRIAQPDRALRIASPPYLIWTPPGMPKLRGNRGIESMTLATGQASNQTSRNRGWTLYSANEDAAETDGPTASFEAGTIVRLQAFRRRSPRLASARYGVDAINGDHLLSNRERSGLVELEALPDGRLLALERAAGATGLRIRLYLIDPRGTLQTTAQAAIPLPKTKLWEKSFLQLNANFEGMTLGPRLPDGTHALILLADNGGTGDHLLYALKLDGLPDATK